METLVPIPMRGRTFAARRRVRLSDMDRQGRLRLDALARYLQDTAIEDVEETGWGLPEHLWFLRRIHIDIEAPFLDDRELDVVTWCSGAAAIAAGRRWSLRGDQGGRVEVDSVWIHLGADARPARLEDFGIYAEAAGGRSVSTHIHLPEPPADAVWGQWPLRATDLDLHGHVNNAAYWQAVEHQLLDGTPDLRRPVRAFLDYGEPVDFGDVVELAEWWRDGRYAAAFVVGQRVKAAARVENSLSTPLSRTS